MAIPCTHSQSHSRASTHDWSVAALLAVIPALALWLLWPGITGPFIFDDFPNLQNLREIGDHFTRESIGRYLAAWQGNPGRPLAALSFLIEDHAWPTDPEAFKRNNLLFHLLVGIGVFALVRKLAWLHEKSRGLADWIALGAMAVWLVHPMQLSTTMLVVQRMTILSSGLMLAGVLAYLAILQRSKVKSNTTAVLALASLAIFGGLAFLAKENGPLIFAYAATLNLTLAAPLVARFPENPRKLLWLGTAGMTILLILALLWQVRDPSAAFASRDFSLAERLLTQSRILWEYVIEILLPNMSTGIFYDDYVVSRGILTPWTTLPALLGLIAAGAGAFIIRRRFPLLSFAVLWFLAGHLIESTVIPLELYFEHRNYLAMLGPILAIVAGLINAGGDLRKPLRAALLLWIALAGFTGHITAKIWGDELTLAEVWALERPASIRANQTLAAAYVDIGFYPAAARVLDRAIERIPDADELEFQRHLLKCIAGQAEPEDFKRLEEIAKSTNWARIVPEVMQSLQRHASYGRCSPALTPERYRKITEALLNNPEYARRSETVAYLNYQMAQMYLDIDRPEASIPYFRESFNARADPQVAINTAQILLYLGRPEQALEALEKIEQQPRPWFKRWLYDYRAQERDLRQRILLMREQQRQAQESNG